MVSDLTVAARGCTIGTIGATFFRHLLDVATSGLWCIFESSQGCCCTQELESSEPLIGQFIWIPVILGRKPDGRMLESRIKPLLSAERWHIRRINSITVETLRISIFTYDRCHYPKTKILAYPLCVGKSTKTETMRNWEAYAVGSNRLYCRRWGCPFGLQKRKVSGCEKACWDV